MNSSIPESISEPSRETMGDDDLPTITLKVNLSCCERCPRELHKLLSNFPGVVSYQIDGDKVTTKGNTNPEELVKKVAKKLHKKRTELLLFEVPKKKTETQERNPSQIETNETPSGAPNRPEQHNHNVPPQHMMPYYPNPTMPYHQNPHLVSNAPNPHLLQPTQMYYPPSSHHAMGPPPHSGMAMGPPPHSGMVMGPLQPHSMGPPPHSGMAMGPLQPHSMGPPPHSSMAMGPPQPHSMAPTPMYNSPYNQGITRPISAEEWQMVDQCNWARERNLLPNSVFDSFSDENTSACAIM